MYNCALSNAAAGEVPPETGANEQTPASEGFENEAPEDQEPAEQSRFDKQLNREESPSGATVSTFPDEVLLDEKSDTEEKDTTAGEEPRELVLQLLCSSL